MSHSVFTTLAPICVYPSTHLDRRVSVSTCICDRKSHFDGLCIVAIRLASVLCVLLLFSGSGPAESIQGTVFNRSKREPEPGQQVVILTTAGELARTTTNDSGFFRFERGTGPNSQPLAVVKVVYEGVEYFQTITSGHDVNVPVYEASRQVAGIIGYLSILQFQVKRELLQVTELHALNNSSNPPLTQVNPDSLVLSTPDGAQLTQAIVADPDGGTLKVPIVPAQEHGKYKIDFPLKPGITKYAITYEVPYHDELIFRRQSQYATKRIGIIVPASMHFRSLGTNTFHSVKDRPGTQELVLDGLSANEKYSFELSGEGELAQSLQPSSPAESSRANLISQVEALASAPWPVSPTQPNGAPSAPPHTISLTQVVVLGAGICAFAGIFIWRMMRRSVSQV
jgi:hypothetical protein